MACVFADPVASGTSCLLLVDSAWSLTDLLLVSSRCLCLFSYFLNDVTLVFPFLM